MNKYNKQSQALIYAKNAGYTCDKNGIVYGLSGNILKLWFRDSRYSDTEYYVFNVKPLNNNGTVHVLVHQFQAYLKYGDEIFKTDCVRHKNGISTDNSWDNILIGSHSDNMYDKDVEVRLAGC